MKTTIEIKPDKQYVITTGKMITVFSREESAATQIGFLQQEVISLRADIESLKDEVEDCEGYDDNEENSFDYDQNHDNKRDD